MIRNGKRRYGTSRHAILRADDILVLEATPDALDEFRSALSLGFADKERETTLNAAGEGLDIVEVVVPKEARVAGKTVLSIGLHWRHQAVLMGISRRGRRSRSKSARLSSNQVISCCFWCQRIPAT